MAKENKGITTSTENVEVVKKEISDYESVIVIGSGKGNLQKDIEYPTSYGNAKIIVANGYGKIKV
jgi:hypothetical protein